MRASRQRKVWPILGTKRGPCVWNTVREGESGTRELGEVGRARLRQALQAKVRHYFILRMTEAITEL